MLRDENSDFVSIHPCIRPGGQICYRNEVRLFPPAPFSVQLRIKPKRIQGTSIGLINPETDLITPIEVPTTCPQLAMCGNPWRLEP